MESESRDDSINTPLLIEQRTQPYDFCECSFLHNLSEDWWSVILGLSSFAICFPLAYCSVEYPALLIWKDGFWDGYNSLTIAVGLPILVVFLCFAISIVVPRFKPDPPVPLVFGVAFLCCIEILSKTIGAQKYMHEAGFGDAFWALMFGMIASQIFKYQRIRNHHKEPDKLPNWLERACFAEFYIKTSVVLLLVNFSEIARLGVRVLFVSTVDTWINLFVIYQIGKRYYADCDQSIIMGATVTICGSSAATAVKTAIGAKEEYAKAAIGVSSLFTIPLIPSLSFFGKYALMLSEDATGALIGGSVDSTGAVIATASVAGGNTLTTATIVKMLQNAMMGVVVLAILFFWKGENEKTKTNKEVLALLWDKFPKFLLGFLFTSLVISCLPSSDDADRITNFCFFVSEWYAGLGFVVIGLEVNKCWSNLTNGGNLIKLYLIGQSLDLVGTALVSWIAFQLV